MHHQEQNLGHKTNIVDEQVVLVYMILDVYEKFEDYDNYQNVTLMPETVFEIHGVFCWCRNNWCINIFIIMIYW